jgi:hypothetical protein
VTNQITPGRARHIMAMHKPRGWRVVMGGAKQRGASGLCDWGSKTLFVPVVCDDYSLHVYLHEVGHARLHRRSTAPSHVCEYEAEHWAFAALRAAGFKVTSLIRRSSKDYVAEEIKKDRLLGLPIDPKIRVWATRKSRALRIKSVS